MALPRINETLNFTMTIPSLGKTVKYRPYLVKEEKVLLQAFESKDTKTCLEAMVDTIGACLDPRENINVSKLATFDIEYMFTQLRSKSVGENSTIFISCKDCKEHNEYTIDLESLNVEMQNNDNIVDITDSIRVEMKYPSYETMLSDDIINAQGDMSVAIDMIAASIEAIHTDQERFDCENQSEEEVKEFILSMTATQLQGLTDYLSNIPALKHNAKFNCIKCGVENELELKGLSDFF